jgi:hypothetical protein
MPRLEIGGTHVKNTQPGNGFSIFNMDSAEAARLNDVSIAETAADHPKINGNGIATGYTPLDLVESYYRRFVAYPSEHAIVAHVLWTAHCHLIECFETTPRLAFMSAEKASGKTRALEVTALFVPAPILSFSTSAAALVRLISKGYEEGQIPTILFDEIDSVFRGGAKEEGAEALRGALNAGYRRGAKSQRCTAHGASVVEFFCFAPLAVAGLKTLPDTLASRAIFIHMRRRAPDEEVESFRLRYHPGEAKPIMEELTEWCAEHASDVAGLEPEMPEGITDRTADCWEPLLAIADIAGNDWPKRARAAARYLTGAAADDVLTSGVELPWKDIRGKPIDDRGLASRLRPYGIKSKSIRIGSDHRKGYLATDFHDDWKRYLPGERDKGDKRDIFDNKNNFVPDVPDVPLSEPDNDPFTSLKDPSLKFQRRT